MVFKDFVIPKWAARTTYKVATGRQGFEQAIKKPAEATRAQRVQSWVIKLNSVVHAGFRLSGVRSDPIKIQYQLPLAHPSFLRAQGLRRLRMLHRLQWPSWQLVSWP